MNPIQKFTFVSVCLGMLMIWNSAAFAQQGGDIPGGVPTVDPGTINQGVTNPGTTGDTTPIGLEDLLGGFDVPEVEIENLRNQPFVGRSLEAFNDPERGGGAHPRSNAETAGGGVTSGGGGGFSFGGGNARGGQGGQGLQQGSNTIIRKSLRTRLSPRIVLANPVTPQQVSTRFQSRLRRIPVTGDAGSSVQIRVEGKTAYLSGVARSSAERDRVERMARLEPGIYKIDNKIFVQQ